MNQNWKTTLIQSCFIALEDNVTSMLRNIDPSLDLDVHLNMLESCKKLGFVCNNISLHDYTLGSMYCFYTLGSMYS